MRYVIDPYYLQSSFRKQRNELTRHLIWLAAAFRKDIEQRKADLQSKSNIQIFISYMREDADTAFSVYHYLKGDGLDPWLDLPRMQLGAVWRQEIKEKIDNADLFIAILSKLAVLERVLKALGRFW